MGDTGMFIKEYSHLFCRDPLIYMYLQSCRVPSMGHTESIKLYLCANK